MTFHTRVNIRTLILAGIVISAGTATFVPGDELPEHSSDSKSPASRGRFDVQQAKRQAEILHTSIHATLQVVHNRYYREDEGLPIPAAIMADVFKELESEHKVTLRWLAVEGLAMNTDHQPKDSFETESVEALKSGKEFYDQTANGLYCRAAQITLSSHCLKCHMPDRKSTKDRVAGLIITIPVDD